MAQPKRVVLVDGSWLIFRAFFAIPPNLTTASGLHTNAIFGFATMFRKLFAGKRPELGAIVLDPPGPTTRDVKFPAYKAQRPSLPGELREQLPHIDRVIEAHGFPMLRVAGFEADDVIGTLAREAEALGHEVVIVTGDKDFMQLVGERIRVVDTLRDVSYDAELVRKKWGVPPSRIVDLLALMGDDVDNVPGVPGIGQKGASQLLEQYGSVDGIYAHLGELKGKQKSALEAGRESALLSRDLCTIDVKVPLPQGIEQLGVRVPDPTAVDTLYRELEFHSLLTGEARADVDAAPIEGSWELAESAERVAQWLAEPGLVAVHPVFDVGAQGGASSGRLAGIGLSRGQASALYVPLAHPDAALELACLRAFLEGDAPKVAHDAKALFVVLARHGVALRGVSFDTMLASFLVDPTKVIPHRLDQVSKEFLQRGVKPAKAVLGAGQEERAWRAVLAAEAAAWAGQAAATIADLAPVLAQRVDESGQREQLEAHDLPLSWVLAGMELEGILVDGPSLGRLGVDFAREKAEVEQRIYALAGREFNVGSTKQLGEILFDELKLPVVKRTKTGYSTDSDVLETLAPKHDIAREILRQRTLAKLINTYTEVLQQAVSPETGRIHATFQQTTGASGRLISTDPDLQRTPVKTAEGKRIRQAFIARPGWKLVGADWSQIELRVLAHFSEDPGLVEAFQKNLDVHRRTAGLLFGCAPEAVTAEQRGVGKTVNFATIYGQGATALGQILGVPRKEAKAFIDGYFAAYAGVRTWLDRTIEEALRLGYVTTLLGRRRIIPELASRNETDRATGERIAANTPIQGSAADLCKVAMQQIAERIEQQGLRAKVLVQIHDELLFEAPEEEVGALSALVRDRMEHCIPLRVPLVVDVGVGASWAETK